MTTTPTLPAELVEEVARAICAAQGRDPDELTWWNNGECMEPWGPAWAHFEEEAAAALSTPSIVAMREALKEADDAIKEMFRYYNGGETRGSYDGKPERAQLRKAGYKVRAVVASLASKEAER